MDIDIKDDDIAGDKKPVETGEWDEKKSQSIEVPSEKLMFPHGLISLQFRFPLGLGSPSVRVPTPQLGLPQLESPPVRIPSPV